MQAKVAHAEMIKEEKNESEGDFEAELEVGDQGAAPLNGELVVENSESDSDSG